jgi:hypothetical protein
MFYKDERLALFIDGSNLYAAAKSLGFDIDYKLLRQEFLRRGKLLRAFYYTALLENDDYSPIRPLVAALQRLHHAHEAGQGIHRQPGPPEGQGQYGHRTDRRCHGTGPAR